MTAFSSRLYEAEICELKINASVFLTVVVGGSKLTGPWQVKESSSARSHWPSHSTHTDPLAYSRISLKMDRRD